MFRWWYQLPVRSFVVVGMTTQEFRESFFRITIGRLNSVPLPYTSSPIFFPIEHHQISPSLKRRSRFVPSSFCFFRFQKSNSLVTSESSHFLRQEKVKILQRNTQNPSYARRNLWKRRLMTISTRANKIAVPNPDTTNPGTM